MCAFRATLLTLLLSLATHTAAVEGVTGTERRRNQKSMVKGMGMGKKLDRVDLIVSLSGEPKSGTSWLEMVAVNIAQIACDPNAPPEENNECTFMPRGRNFRIYWNNGRVGVFQRGGSCITHKTHKENSKQGCATSKHQMFPLCADESNTGLHHPANIAQGCASKNANDRSGCPCWLQPPPLNASKHDMDTYRNALEQCAAQVFKPGQACEASVLPRDENAHGIEERYLLIARDPRDVAVSEHFWKGGAQTTKHKLESKLERRVPIIGSWVALRYFLAEQFNSASAVHRRRKAAEDGAGAADGGRTHPAPDPYLVVLYNSLRTSLAPYRKICRLLDFKHCSDSMLQRAKDSKSAAALKEHKKDGEGGDTLLWRSKIRSAGKKDLGSYELTDEILTFMAEYTEQVLPKQFAADLKAGSLDWHTHKLKTGNEDI